MCMCSRAHHTHTNSIMFTWYWPTVPGYGACPKLWLINPVTFRWRELIFSFPNGINCKRLLGLGWDLVSISPFPSWDFV